MRAMILAAIGAAALLGPAGPPVRAQTVQNHIVLLRLIDDSLQTGLDGADLRIDRAVLNVSSLPRGEYRVTTSLATGVHRLSIRRIGYHPRDIEFTLHADSIVNLGVIRLRPAMLVIDEYMVVPDCRRVWKKPRLLRAGTWLRPAKDSAGRKAWLLCDGLRRDKHQ